MSEKPDNPVDYENLEDVLEEGAEEEETTETGEEGEEEEAPETGDDDEEEEEQPEDGDDPRIPEKFKGKSAAEIAEAYTNLEAHVNQKAIDIARSMLPGGQKPDAKSVQDTKDMEDDFGLTEEQMKNMSPKQFLAHVNKTITERAQKIVQETLQRTTDMQSTVRKEIREVTKVHPHRS